MNRNPRKLGCLVWGCSVNNVSWLQRLELVSFNQFFYCGKLMYSFDNYFELLSAQLHWKYGQYLPGPLEKPLAYKDLVIHLLLPFCHGHLPGHLQNDPVVDLISLGPHGGNKKLVWNRKQDIAIPVKNWGDDLSFPLKWKQFQMGLFLSISSPSTFGPTHPAQKSNEGRGVPKVLCTSLADFIRIGEWVNNRGPAVVFPSQTRLEELKSS